jgi:UDP-glucose 4-epimerase
MKRKNKVLVTGGSGFLGSHLVDALIKEGNDVVVLDQVAPSTKMATFIQGSFDNDKIVQPILEKVNQVFHLAAIVGVDNCDNNPSLVNDININATKMFIDWVANADIDRIVFTSSSEVYGNIKEVPFHEDMVPSPVSLYGGGKVVIEKYLKKVSKSDNLSVGIARLFNVYGPRQKSQFVVPIFLDKALKNEDIIVFGDGNQKRCFTYVEDVVHGLIKLMAHKSRYDIFNLGNKTEYSMNELAEIVVSAIPNCKSKVIHKKHGTHGVRSVDLEIQRRIPDANKAEQILDFRAQTPLLTGIVEMIKYNE